MLALQPVDLDVKVGDYLAITGPSGSGKSTLLNVLGLLDTPTGGTYLLDGIDVTGLSDRNRAAVRGHKIGFVFQFFHLLTHRTSLENVELGMAYLGVDPRSRRHRARESLEAVGLAHRIHALPSTLSGGERQRVAIARALATRPRLLLCDEPTGNLDSDNSGEMLELFDNLHANGATLVVITHDDAVARRAERRVGICDGQLVEDR